MLFYIDIKWSTLRVHARKEVFLWLVDFILEGKKLTFVVVASNVVQNASLADTALPAELLDEA